MSDEPQVPVQGMPPGVVRGVFELRNPPPVTPRDGEGTPLPDRGAFVVKHTLVGSAAVTYMAVVLVAWPLGWSTVSAGLGFAPVAVALGNRLARVAWRARERSWRRDHLRDAFGASDPVVDITPLIARRQELSSGIVREWGGEPGPTHGMVRVRWTDPDFVPSFPVEVRVAGRSAGWVGDEPNSIALCMPAGLHSLRAWIYREGVASEPLTVEVRPGGELVLELRCNFAPGVERAPPPDRQLILRIADVQEHDHGGTADEP